MFSWNIFGPITYSKGGHAKVRYILQDMGEYYSGPGNIAFHRMEEAGDLEMLRPLPS